MTDSIPFVIPQKFLGAYKSGTVKRFGTLLMQGNRIVGHVQEAGFFHDNLIPSSNSLLASSNPISVLMNVGTLASSVTANIQLEQVKSMLMSLQLLSGATLAASVAGIGVSAAGFTVVNKKLNILSRKIQEISQELDQVYQISQRVEARQVARDQSKLSSLLGLSEEAWMRQDKFSVWKKLIDQLFQEEQYYRSLLSQSASTSNIFLDKNFPLDYCILSFENLVCLHAARIQALFLCGELDAAKYYINELTEWYSTNFEKISPSDIVASKSFLHAGRTGGKLEDARLDLLKIAKPFMEGVREIQINMATGSQLIQSLINQEIDGYEYVKRTRAEASSPILILPVKQ